MELVNRMSLFKRYHRIRCKISNTYRYMAVRNEKKRVVLKNWVAVAVLQLRLRVVCVWVYMETCQKKCRELRLRWAFAFLCIALVV